MRFMSVVAFGRSSPPQFAPSTLEGGFKGQTDRFACVLTVSPVRTRLNDTDTVVCVATIESRESFHCDHKCALGTRSHWPMVVHWARRVLALRRQLGLKQVEFAGSRAMRARYAKSSAHGVFPKAKCHVS